MADLDSDGKAEVIFASWVQKKTNRTGKLHILDYQGNPLHEVNLPAAFGSPDWNGALPAPTLANIDDDNDLELVLNTAHSGLVAYDLPGTANAQILWGTGRGSYKRNGISAAEEGFTLIATPASQAIEAGQAASYTLKVQAGSSFSETVTLTTVSALPNLVLGLTPTTLTPPDQATLTVTDTHPGGPLLPGVWHNIPITATGGDITRTTTVKLLVGGTQSNLPIILR